MIPKLRLSDIASINQCSAQYIHKVIREKQIPVSKQGNGFCIESAHVGKLIKYPIPKKTIAIQTVKGGVGKTVIASALGVRLHMLGAKVLFIDSDYQGNLSKNFDLANPEYVLQDLIEEKIKPEDAVINIRDGLSILPSSLRNVLLSSYIMIHNIRSERVIKPIIKKFQSYYDIIIIDCPPAIGPAVTAVSIASDMVISPLDPDSDAFDGMALSFNEIKKMNKEYGSSPEFKILLNKYDSRTLLSSKIIPRLQENPEYNENLFETIIRVSAEFPKAKDEKRSIFDSPRIGKARKDIDSLAREVMGWPLPDEAQN